MADLVYLSELSLANPWGIWVFINACLAPAMCINGNFPLFVLIRKI